jgi:hormone-sensitive lipase
MGLILKLKLKMPQGIFLAYPACDLRKIYSPSRIHSFSDAILHPPLLLLCLKEYLGNNSSAKESDPLATPLLLTEEYVNANKGDYRFPLKWPKTRIIVGEMDPLLDDSLRLCEKLCYSGIDYQCKIFKDLGHGFLSI